MTTKITILAVDDDPDILRVLRANLELYGFTIQTAPDCREAAGIIEDTPPDLLILDLTLPSCDGVSFCRELKTTHPLLPVIMLTARDLLSDKVIGLESGADDYMVKPFETLELLARIRVCLRRTKPQEPILLSCGDLRLEVSERKATLGGSPLDLTPKEFDLLRLLLEAQGKVLSREAIRRGLWKDSKLYTWSRIIDVHIQHLRTKIESDTTSPRYIHTVPGIGYRCCRND